MIGYKTMALEDGKLRSVADKRIEFPLGRGTVMRMPGRGIYLSTSRQFVLDYYTGMVDGSEVLLTLEFDPDKLVTGNLTDRDGEISVREATIVDYEVLPPEENPLVRRLQF